MPYDIIEEAAPESGGFEILEEQETPGELSGIVNSFRRGNLAAQRAIEAVQMTPETGPTFRQGRRGFVQAMEDPEYLNRLMMAGDDADAMRKAESLYGPGRRVQAMTDPQRQANIATAENISDLSRRADAIPQSAAMQEWAKADNSNWWQVFARNPVEITANIFAESLPQAAPTMAATMATGGMGRFAAAGAGGAGSFGMEAANSLVDAAASQGVDLHDPEQVRAFFADENKVKAAREFAMQRGLPIGLLDALTVGVAGKFLKPALGKGAARVAGATAAEAGAQMAGGAGGEALAQVASGQDLNVRDIAAEAIGELATAPGEVVGNLRAENRNRGFEVIEEGAGDKLKVPSSKPATSNLKPEPVSTPTVEDLKALEAAMRGNQLKPKEETASTTKPTAKAADIALDDLPEAAQEQLTRRMTAPPAEPEPVLRPLPPKSVEFKPTEEMRAAMEFQKRTDEAVRAALENPDKNYDAMTRQELEMLDSLGDAQAKAALRRGMFQGANVGSASANVGSPSANVGSLVANVEPAPLQPENRSVTEKPKSELPAETDAARVRREAKEFDKLLLDYGMEAGWVRAPEVLYDETASVQTGHGTASIKAKILRSKEMAGVRRRAAQELGALDAADMGDAKKRAALLPKLRELVEQRFAGPRKQAEAFSQATTAGKVPVPIGELKVGDTLNIEGDLVRVVEVSPDGEVTLQDGTRFGRQVMQDGSTIYAEEWQSEPAEPGAGFEAVEEPAQPAVKESLTVEQKAAEEVKAPTGSTSDLEIARDLLRRERKLSAVRWAGDSIEEYGYYPETDAIESALDKLKIETPPGSLQAFGLLPATWNQLIEIVRAAYRAGKTAAQAIRAGMDWLQAQGVKDYDAAGIQAHFEKELATADKDKAVTLEDLQQRLERLELQIIRSRRKGTAQATRALLDERAKLQEEFNALRYGAEQEAQAVEQQPAAPIPTFTQSQLDSVSSATMDGAPTAESFWEGFKRFLRFFATNTPEIAVTGPEAERASLFRRGVRLFGVETNNARRTAAREINKVLEPLKALGRDVTNPDAVDKFFALGKRIKREEARANPNEEKLATLREQQQAVREKLEGNPWYLFQQAVLWRDLWYRAKFLKTPSGGEITLPGGLELDQVESAMARNKELIDANPHAAAIRDSLKRHYKLMGDLQESLLQHGELIPDELRNPLYFPHHLLEKFTGKLDRARPTTEKDFRAYLIAPVGSEKLIEAGYLNALYKHVNDVTVHNARADVVEKYWRPYDEAAKRQKEIEADAAERGEEDVHPDAWKRNLPPGMELFTPSEEIPMRADYILNRGELAKALGVALPANGDLRGVLAQTGADIRLTGDMIQKAMVAGERPQWLLPSEIAEAIRGVVRREQAKTADTVGRRIGRVLAKPIQLWKGNTLFNWYNYPRYEWGNTITDVIDKMLGADPGMARYLGRALKEVRDAANGERTAEIDAAEREGVLQTVTAQEVGELAKLPEFEDFLTSKQWRMEKVRKFVTWTARASQLRESTFRYAKFLADLERIRRGEQPVYAGAYWRDVQAAKTPEAKAAEITLKTFGDYGNLSVVGNFLREHVIPFWSWQEINLSYHANLFRNLRDMLTLPAEERPGSVKDAARAAAVSTATFTGRAAIGIALRLALMRLAVEMWNQFGGAWAGLWDEDDDLEGQLSEADRRRFHLLLGKDEQGRARVVYVPNALSDVAEWFGGNNFARLFTEWAKGDIPFGQFVGDFAKQAPTDLVNKVVQGARPDAKFAYMAVSGKDPFPDVTDQRDISRENLGWMLMQTVTDRDAATFLRSQLDKDFYAPEGLSEWLGRKLLQVRRRDPEQWAYYEIRDKAADWKEARTGKRNEGFDYQSPDQQVIRNFRKAIYRGDLDNAVRFYNRLRDYGYTNQRFAASIRNSDPLSDLTKLERREFEQGLTQYERELLARARRYYGRLSASKGRERALFPSNPRSTARPSEERIKTLLAPRE